MLRKIAVEMLKKHEGLRLKPYRCTAGKLTIGYGRNLEDVGISEKEALQMLKHDVNSYRELLTARYQWFESLSTDRKAVCINMAFNLGMRGFHGFRRMRRCLKQGDYPQAVIEMLDSKWAKQVGYRATELAQIMEEGKL
jgi:lysozyme